MNKLVINTVLLITLAANAWAVDLSTNVDTVYTYNTEASFTIPFESNSSLTIDKNDLEYSINYQAYQVVQDFYSIDNDNKKHRIKFDASILHTGTNKLVLSYQKQFLKAITIVVVKPTFYFKNDVNKKSAAENKLEKDFVEIELLDITTKQLRSMGSGNPNSTPKTIVLPEELDEKKISFGAFYYGNDKMNLKSGVLNTPVELNVTEGYNKFYFKATNIDEIPNVNLTKIENKEYLDSVRFFYLGIEGDSIFYQNNETTKLIGFPRGGWFDLRDQNQDLVLSDINYLKTSELSVGKYFLTYKLPFQDEEIETTRQIEIISTNFSISGNHAVCMNAKKIKYEIIDYQEHFDYEWNIVPDTLGEFVGGNMGRTVYIDWNNKLNGFATIKVEAKKDGLIYNSSETEVLVKEIKATDPPNLFFGDQEERLVICDDTLASKYLWSIDGANEVESAVNFYYFNSTGSEYQLRLIAQNGCETAVTELYSTMNKSTLLETNSKVTNIDEVRNLETGFRLFPNPAKNTLTIKLNNADAKSYQILNLTSQVILSGEFSQGRREIKVDVSHVPSGQYFVRIFGKDKVVSSQFIKTK